MITNYGDYYYVSQNGDIYSNKDSKYLSPRKDKDGYLIIDVMINGERKTKKIHRMVMEVYSPNENSNELTVNHKDGNKTNNNLSNLEWMTNLENIAHAYKNGLINVNNENNGMSKLTQSQVDEIINLYNTTSLSQEKIGKMFGVAQTEVSRIVNKKRRSDSSIEITGNKNRKVFKCDKNKIDKIISLYLSGMKQKEIAEKVEVSISTVERTIHNYKHNK